KAIVRYGELEEQDRDAQDALARAAKAVTDAEATGIASAAAARVSGDKDPGDAGEAEARETYELATREAAISKAAVHQAGEAIEQEAWTHRDAYTAKLDKRIEAAQKTGLNALAKLEEALHEIRVIRAYRNWIESPQT